ncbi:MAG: M56 and MltD domain-containing protein [Bdellovibrionota bacterium]
MVTFINWFLCIHALVVIASLGFWIFRKLSGSQKLLTSAASELKLHYLFFVIILVLPVVFPKDVDQFKFEPIAKVDYSATIKKSSGNIHLDPGQIRIQDSRPIPMNVISYGLMSFIFLSLVSGITLWFRDRLKLKSIMKQSVTLKNLNSVRIVFSESVSIPFSYRSLITKWIVLPSDFLGAQSKTKISILHEMQHHRQGDTLWLHFILLLRYFLCLNPFMALWNQILQEVQELACDENLVDQGKVDTREYATCLLAVAQTAVSLKSPPACAAGMAFVKNRHILTRRIESMFTEKENSFWKGVIAAGIFATALASTAWASNDLLEDQRISQEQAEKMVLKANSDGNFHVVLNARVLRQLNWYLGTSEGRKFIKASFERMDSMKEMLDTQVNDHRVPEKLLAIPIVESGYQNLAANQNPYKAAGLWQFIKSTAHNYGLKVDNQVDERLDVDLETDAAFRYLKALNLRFKNWQLAILAYNMGEQNVQRAIDKVGSRVAFDLVRAGYEGDKDYLAKVNAAIIIYKNR